MMTDIHPLEEHILEVIAFLEAAIAEAQIVHAATAAPVTKMEDRSHSGSGHPPIGFVWVPGGGNVNPYEPNEFILSAPRPPAPPPTGGTGSSNSGGGGGGGW